MSWKIPVIAPYRVTSDARDHNLRSTLCGIDFVSCAAHPQRWLYAMAGGEVAYIHSAYDARYRKHGETFHSLGRFVVLKHAVGDIPVWVRYCHNEKVDVQLGQSVEEGEALGMYGSTGYCIPDGDAGAHLHVDCWVAEDSLAAAEQAGLVQAPGKRAVSPWPGAPVLWNVNPTAMLADAGLDVLNRGGA